MMRHVLLAASVLLCGSCSDDGGDEPDSGAADAAPRDAAVDRALPQDDSSVDGPLSDGAAPADRGARPDGPAAADAATICQQLEADYASLLGRARECNPWTEMNECTKKIPDNLGCPCDTYVNTGKLSELKQLFALTQQWAAEGCPPCKTGPCRPLAAGDCEELPSGTSGHCVDLIP